VDGEGAGMTGGALIPGTMTWAMSSAVHAVQHSGADQLMAQEMPLVISFRGYAYERYSRMDGKLSPEGLTVVVRGLLAFRLLAEAASKAI
jgi:hypothetical protein